MEMESVLCSSSTVVDLESIMYSMVVETALLTQKSLLCLLFVMRSRPTAINVILTTRDQRFPLAGLNDGQNPAAENMDAGETEDAKNKKKKAVDYNDGQNDDDSEEEESDDDEDDAEGESDDEDDDDDDDEDDEEEEEEDEDDDEDDDDDEEDEEDEPPSKRKK